MNVQNLKLQFSNPESRPSNVVRTQIPVARFGFGNRNAADNSVNGNPPSSPHHSPVHTSPTGFPSPDKWRAKHDDVEKKRKTLLTQNQKLTRDHEDLQRRYSQVQRELETSKREVADRDIKLDQLRKLSEAVYKEYDQLKNQYELETGTMQKAMQRASEWYKQNRELKRRSTALMERVMRVAPSSMTDFTDDTDSGVSTDNDDFEDLRKSVQELNHDVARLQAEVNAAKLQEFEAQETIVELTTQLEDERNARSLLQSELQELRAMRDNLGQVSRLVAAEVSSLREQCEKEKETAQRMKQDADKAKKERNVLAHQSQMLMCEVAADQRLLQVVMEVEALKRSLEEEQQKHAAELQALQEKLEQQEGEAHLELVEEKLKLVEAELQCALQRAERAETISKQLSSKVMTLEEELENSSQAPPPPPPPLPPPPPPMPLLAPSRSVTLRRRPSCDGAETTTTSSAVLEMANLLGIPRKTAATPTVPGAIDEIINQIKGGRFTLKSTEPKARLSKVDEQPPVVQEMINVLGTLRKRRTPSMRRKLDNGSQAQSTYEPHYTATSNGGYDLSANDQRSRGSQEPRSYEQRSSFGSNGGHDLRINEQRSTLGSNGGLDRRSNEQHSSIGSNGGHDLRSNKPLSSLGINGGHDLRSNEQRSSLGSNGGHDLRSNEHRSSLPNNKSHELRRPNKFTSHLQFSI